MFHRINEFLEKRHASYLHDQALEKFQNAPDKEQVEAEFVDSLQSPAHPHFKHVLESYQQQGLQSKTATSTLKGYLVNYWNLSETITQETFMADENYEIKDNPQSGYILLKDSEPVSIET